MKRREEEMLCDLFLRMAHHIDNGLDPDTALTRAADELAQDIRTVAAIERNALRERGITRH